MTLTLWLLQRYRIDDLLDVLANHHYLQHVDVRRNKLSYRSTLLLINFIHRAKSLRSIGISVGSTDEALNVNHRRLLWTVCTSPSIDTLFVHFDRNFDASVSMAQIPGNIENLYVSGTVTPEALRALANAAVNKRAYFKAVSLTDIHVANEYEATMQYILQRPFADAIRFQIEPSEQEQPGDFASVFVDMQQLSWPCKNKFRSSLNVFDAACAFEGLVYMNEHSDEREQICKFIKRHQNLAVAYYHH